MRLHNKISLNRIAVSGIISAIMLTMVGCHSGGSKLVESASVTDTAQQVLPDTDRTAAIITNMGVSSIKRGTLVIDIEPEVENLYDTIVVENDYDKTCYRFMSDGGERFVGYEFGDGVISVLSVSDETVVADTPQGKIGLGMPFKRVLDLKGVLPEFQSLDGNGMWSWTWQGLYFLPSQGNLPQRLSSKLYSAGTIPDASDFDDSVTVDYIGTGMPY